jgi:hypothetical protein
MRRSEMSEVGVDGTQPGPILKDARVPHQTSVNGRSSKKDVGEARAGLIGLDSSGKHGAGPEFAR